MYCQNCGTPVSDNDRFCPNCGAPIPESEEEKSTPASQVQEHPAIHTRSKIPLLALTGGGLLAVLLAVFGIAFYLRRQSEPSSVPETIEDLPALFETSTDPAPSEPATETTEVSHTEASAAETAAVSTETTETIETAETTEAPAALDYGLYRKVLINLVNNCLLPDGSTVDGLTGSDISANSFAICDINMDGTEELIINLDSLAVADSLQYIYRPDTSGNSVEGIGFFRSDSVYYDNGYVKEPLSHNQGLSENFWPYYIYLWDNNGYQDAGGAEAWERNYQLIDFNGRSFPDSADKDGNGVVYYISGEQGMDYDNPVDDDEYKTYENRVFGNAHEIQIPWESLTAENIKALPGYDGTPINPDNSRTEGNSHQIPAAYRPGMRVDGIYTYDNGVDTVYTADIHLGDADQGYLSISAKTYNGENTYNFYAQNDGLQICENDTGDYIVSSDQGSTIVMRVTFTDGGIYIDAEEFSVAPFIDGYYTLQIAYDPEIGNAANFSDAYIFPDSDKRLLTQEDLARVVAPAFLRYAKNEIYARHGRQFASKDLNAYFHTKSWYEGSVPASQFDESFLSEIEKNNVTIIQNYMDLWY